MAGSGGATRPSASGPGYLAVCPRVPDTDLFAAVVFHEWLRTENPVTEGRLPTTT